MTCKHCVDEALNVLRAYNGVWRVTWASKVQLSQASQSQILNLCCGLTLEMISSIGTSSQIIICMCSIPKRFISARLTCPKHTAVSAQPQGQQLVFTLAGEWLTHVAVLNLESHHYCTHAVTITLTPTHFHKSMDFMCRKRRSLRHSVVPRRVLHLPVIILKSDT